MWHPLLVIHHAHNTQHISRIDQLERENELLRRDNQTLLLRARSLLTFNRLLLDRINGKAA